MVEEKMNGWSEEWSKERYEVKFRLIKVISQIMGLGHERILTEQEIGLIKEVKTTLSLLLNSYEKSNETSIKNFKSKQKE